MQISQAVNCWLEYHRSHSKKNTIRSYEFIGTRLCEYFGGREVDSITTDEVLTFLNTINESTKPYTRKGRYSYLTSFFNFLKNNVDQEFHNPCDSPMLRKIFRSHQKTHWNVVEKELVDEIIFRTNKSRNRLVLELMARGGMRVSEVLNLMPQDVNDRKLMLREPKSGKEYEVVYIPQKIADRLKEYIQQKAIKPDERIFPITYGAARIVVLKAGQLVGINLRPHDLRRHAATYASRSGVPIEIVSKVILRHANLSTTQRYLGKVSDVEAIRWIENVYG